MSERGRMDVVPECYVDTNIVSTLLGGERVNHQKGCGRVRQKIDGLKNSFAVGIVDNDKHEIYKETYKEIAHSDSLTLLKDENEPHYLILIGKEGEAAEAFLLSCAKKLSIDMSKFGLPGDLKGLKNVTKNIDAINDPRIKRLVKYLMNNAQEMGMLKQVIAYLVKEEYKAKEKELTGMLTSNNA